MSWRFECVREGPGRAVVLLPGLQGDPEIFRPLLPFLPEDRSVWRVRFTVRGAAEDARCLVEALEQNGVVGADLICGSYGGQVALMLQASLRSIVLTASFPQYRTLSARARLSLLLSLGMPGGILGFLYRQSLKGRLLRDGVDVSTANAVTPPSGAALQARLDSLRDLGSDSDEGVALLWLMGMEDTSVTWLESDMRMAWPQVQVQRVAGGHRPYASHPKIFADVVSRWWLSMETQ